MKAITICQPYAELIASGAKRVENRTWTTKYRGELAIHAGKSRAFLGEATKPRSHGATEGEGLVFGAVIAIARLVDCLPLEEALRRCGQIDEMGWVAQHLYTEGPICWILRDVRRIEPVYCSGFQGLWQWNGATVVA